MSGATFSPAFMTHHQSIIVFSITCCSLSQIDGSLLSLQNPTEESHLGTESYYPPVFNAPPHKHTLNSGTPPLCRTCLLDKLLNVPLIAPLGQKRFFDFELFLCVSTIIKYKVFSGSGMLSIATDYSDSCQ